MCQATQVGAEDIDEEPGPSCRQSSATQEPRTFEELLGLTQVWHKYRDALHATLCTHPNAACTPASHTGLALQLALIVVPSTLLV